MNGNNYEVPWSERPAVAAPPDLHARYDTGRTPAGRDSYVTTPIYAFSVAGHALVFDEGSHRLVRPEVLAGDQTKMTYTGIHTPLTGPPLAGPFTPAPAGLVAVFSDEREQPVLFYDVHGRAVLMDTADVTCDLVLAENIADLVRVDYRREPTPD